MTNWFKAFAADENGAITVDWVVLTASLVGLAIGIFLVMEAGTLATADNISASVEAIEVTN